MFIALLWEEERYAIISIDQVRCKPAVPLAGKYRLVDIPISNCINSGYNRIYLLSQFNTASLHRHVQDAYRFDRFGKGFVEILSAEQTEDGDDWYQGTADAVRRNLIHFGAHDEDIFVILSGDQLYRMDFSKMVDEHLQRGAEITVAAKPVPTNEASGLGLLRVNEEFGIVDFVEKPTDQEVISRLVPPSLKAMVRVPIDVWRRWEFMSSMLQQCLMHWKEIRETLEKK